jgi:DNA (cytosine-5)-methyltransferase 1
VKLLDLFSGAGGAAVGYHRAGFDTIVGVDHRPQPRYPFQFVQADALDFCASFGAGFDVIHASPPCQAYSLARNNGCHPNAPKLIEHTRAVVRHTGRHFIIENVPFAPLRFSMELCGASFGLGAAGLQLARHRRFESSVLILAPPCRHIPGRTIGVYGHGVNAWHRQILDRNIRAHEFREAMGIDWMTRDELNEAIPPAYTEFIGKQLIDALR